ncbi:hypothetical protein K470DRAFT_278787 [Piedraia hortae CBS 480.64]|uniref:GST N-terminal domain-containing protein n=1 Tax=Piedraia hortae CBS 480.64 TaxID=1314780 RepID=A0A6A7BTN8_9PEZI|nr:hypothetical protein K470DRAFT_278787 [Piedraia hortae CBS 480.64]
MTDLLESWHKGPNDGFHGKITANGPFHPEKGRYHLYIGLFCPFAQRANFVRLWKQLDKYAEIDVSIVKAYPRGDDKGWPGWRFNHPEESYYEGATEDKLFGSRFMHEIYFKADPEYKGRYSVPVLWDRKRGTIVNNESEELLRDLQSAFNSLLPPSVADLTLYPAELSKGIDSTAQWVQSNLNFGVYKAGFASDQATYEENLFPIFAALNRLEKLAKSHGGPYILGTHMTEIDVRVYATLIRFDVAYVQHFKCNLGMVRDTYPVLHNWLKHMYWDHNAFKASTDFRHIKENYTKSQPDVNPKGITPVGPWPDIEKSYESNWSKVELGHMDMPRVLEHERNMQ